KTSSGSSWAAATVARAAHARTAPATRSRARIARGRPPRRSKRGGISARRATSASAMCPPLGSSPSNPAAGVRFGPAARLVDLVELGDRGILPAARRGARVGRRPAVRARAVGLPAEGAHRVLAQPAATRLPPIDLRGPVPPGALDANGRPLDPPGVRPSRRGRVVLEALELLHGLRAAVGDALRLRLAPE